MGENGMYRILVCDDERDIVSALRIYLTAEGYEVLEAYNGSEMLRLAATQEVHLILLDVMMPGMDGLSAMAELRRTSNVPVILLTAKSEDTDKVLGLNLGADDYVTKPFNPIEVLARVKSQLRRYVTFSGSFGERDDVLQCDGLVINNTTKEVLVDGEPVRLTPIEYKILHLLMQNQGRVFSIDEIYEKVWNEPSFNAENTVAVHIRRIREKIEFDPKKPKYLKVVWGLGYKIEKL